VSRPGPRGCDPAGGHRPFINHADFVFADFYFRAQDAWRYGGDSDSDVPGTQLDFDALFHTVSSWRE
jgi:hypothetical protein